MDFSYYPATAQPYQFSAFPPTPDHSYEAQDDAMVDAQGAYQGANGFSSYDPTYQFSSNGFLQPDPEPGAPAGLSAKTHTPPNSNHRPSITSLPSNEQSNGGPRSGSAGENENQDAQNGSRSDSDDKESMTPQQSRRKAQNRAAQRAFRERKEKRVKELETKLSDLSEHSSNLLSENERLKKELQRLATRNEILRATAAQPQAPPRAPSPVHGPQTYSPTDFITAVGVDVKLHPVSFESYDGVGGQNMLSAGATWDTIQRHELVRRGTVSTADVILRLKGKSVCDGRGPAFREAEVLRAIEESAGGGSDELI